ncbi:UNVERIFIED_CONTAM: hypothetical protein Sradi_5278000 [Sesamum radiatum]|uniref:Uncharacterized protein n=1 Tax=Sesamum radiatum TaxID=300843 RepID=A0AAW2LLY8_SESRA
MHIAGRNIQGGGARTEGDPEKITRIGWQISLEAETMTLDFPRKNSNMFAWIPFDFQGIDPEVIVHRLNVDPQARPIKQKKRPLEVERNQVIEEEVSKLLKLDMFQKSNILAGYQTWSSYHSQISTKRAVKIHTGYLG